MPSLLYRIRIPYHEKGIDDLEANDSFTMNTRETRGRGMKIMKRTSRLILKKFSFSHRVVDNLGLFAKKVVEARYVEQFKAKLDEAWEDIRLLSVFCTLPHKPQIPREGDLNATRRAP